MIGQRATILNIEQTRKKLLELGAVFDDEYACKDIIFVPKKEEYNLSDDFLRARVYSKNNWSTKKVVLVRKQTEFTQHGKIDHVILRKEFDTEHEAFDFVTKELGNEFVYGFEFEREGWEYKLGHHNIFIEDIKEYQPSIEIETDSKDDLVILFEKIGVGEKVTISIPEIMRRILQSKSRV